MSQEQELKSLDKDEPPLPDVSIQVNDMKMDKDLKSPVKEGSEGKEGDEETKNSRAVHL